MGIKPLTHLAFGLPVPSPLRVSEELKGGDYLPVLVQIDTKLKEQ